MTHLAPVTLRDVQAVYSGPEGDLWELVMGQQIHIGGFRSSMELAEKAGIGAGMSGRRSLLLHRGGDALPGPLPQRGADARRRCHGRPSSNAGAAAATPKGLADRITFALADVCDTGLPDAAADFVWGEDAWCYVVDKRRLVAEAVRLLKPGGLMAFTDWVDGRHGFTDGEAERYRRFMKFPNTLGHRRLCRAAGRTGLRGARGRRHRPVCALCGPLSQHAEHAVDLRCPADHRLRCGLDGIAGRPK